MIPADRDRRVVWSAYVISKHLLGWSPTEISIKAHREERMAMTREDVLKFLRAFVDYADKDVKITREAMS